MKKLFTVNLIFCFLFAQVPVQALVSPITPARTQTAVTAPLQKAVNDTNNEDLFDILKQIVDAMYKGQTGIAGADAAAYEPNERLTEQEQDAMEEFNRDYVASLLAEVMTDVNGNASHPGRPAQLQTIAAKLLPVIFDYLSPELSTTQVSFQGTSSRLPTGASAQGKTIEFAGKQFEKLIEQGKGEDATHIAMAVVLTYYDHSNNVYLKDLLVDWVYDEDGKYTPVILPILGEVFLKTKPKPKLLADIILADDAGDELGTSLLAMIPSVTGVVEGENGSDIFHKNISGSYYQGPSERKNLRNAWLDFGKEWGQEANKNREAKSALDRVVVPLLATENAYFVSPSERTIGGYPTGATPFNPIYPFLFGAFSTGYRATLSTHDVKSKLARWYTMFISPEHGGLLLDQYTARYFKNVIALGYNRLSDTRSPDNLTLNAGDHYQCNTAQVQQNGGEVGSMVCQYSSPDPGDETGRETMRAIQNVALTVDIILAVVALVQLIGTIRTAVQAVRMARLSKRIAQSVKLMPPAEATRYIQTVSSRIAKVKGWNEATTEKLIESAIKKYNGEVIPPVQESSPEVQGRPQQNGRTQTLANSQQRPSATENPRPQQNGRPQTLANSQQRPSATENPRPQQNGRTQTPANSQQRPSTTNNGQLGRPGPGNQSSRPQTNGVSSTTGTAGGQTIALQNATTRLGGETGLSEAVARRKVEDLARAFGTENYEGVVDAFLELKSPLETVDQAIERLTKWAQKLKAPRMRGIRNFWRGKQVPRRENPGNFPISRMMWQTDAYTLQLMVKDPTIRAYVKLLKEKGILNQAGAEELLNLNFNITGGFTTAAEELSGLSDEAVQAIREFQATVVNEEPLAQAMVNSSTKVTAFDGGGKMTLKNIFRRAFYHTSNVSTSGKEAELLQMIYDEHPKIIEALERNVRTGIQNSAASLRAGVVQQGGVKFKTIEIKGKVSLVLEKEVQVPQGGWQLQLEIKAPDGDPNQAIAQLEDLITTAKNPSNVTAIKNQVTAGQLALGQEETSVTIRFTEEEVFSRTQNGAKLSERPHIHYEILYDDEMQLNVSVPLVIPKEIETATGTLKLNNTTIETALKGAFNQAPKGSNGVRGYFVDITQQWSAQGPIQW